jgi:hypothetical protein
MHHNMIRGLRDVSRDSETLGVRLRDRLAPHWAHVSIMTVMFALEAKDCPILLIIHVILSEDLTPILLT